MADVTSQALFLIARFLRDCTPCRDAATALERELGEHGLLGRQMLWTGCQVPRTLASMTSLNQDVPSNRLMTLLQRQWAAENGSLLTDSKYGARENRQLPNTAAAELITPASGPLSASPSNIHAEKKGSAPCEGSTAWLHQRITVKALPSARCVSSVALMPDVARRKLHVTMQVSGHRWHGLCCLQYDRTGRVLISGADDTLIKVWSAESGRLQVTLRGFTKVINDVGVSPDNSMVVGVSADSAPVAVRVWSLQTGEPVAVLRGHTGTVVRCIFDPVYGVLVTASEDGSVRVWDLKHQYEQSGRGFKRNDRNCVIEIGSNFAVFEHRNSNGSGVPLKITAIDVCPLGAYVATGTADGVVRVFRYLSPDPAFPSGGRFVLDATQFDPLAGHTSEVTWIQWSRRGDRLMTAARKDGTIRIWRWENYVPQQVILKSSTGEVPQTSSSAGPRRSTAPSYHFDMCSWSLDDRFVITTQVRNANMDGIDPTDIPAIEAALQQRTKVWDSNTGTLLRVLEGHTMDVVVVDVHPWDPRLVLTCGYDGRVIIWNIMSGKPWRRFRLMNGDPAPETDGFEPPEKPRFVDDHCGNPDEETIIGSPANGRAAVYEGGFHPNGYSFAVGDSNGRLTVFNMGRKPVDVVVPYEQYLSDDYNALIMDEALNVADAVTQHPPHVGYAKQSLHNIEMVAYPVNPPRLLPGTMPPRLEEVEFVAMVSRAQAFHKGMSAEARTKGVSRRNHIVPASPGLDARLPQQMLPQAPTTRLRDSRGGPGRMDSARTRNRRQILSDSSSSSSSSCEAAGSADVEDSSEFDEEEVVSQDPDDDSASGSSGSEDLVVPERLSSRLGRHNVKPSSSRRTTRQATHAGDATLISGLPMSSGDEARPSRVSRRARKTKKSYEDLLDSEETDDLSGVHSDESDRLVVNRSRSVSKPKSAPSSNSGRHRAPDVNFLTSRAWLQTSTATPLVYVPQVGDEVVYFPQGHVRTLRVVPSSLPPPWTTWPRSWFAVLCRVDKVSYRFPDANEVNCGVKSVVSSLTLQYTAISNVDRRGKHAWLSTYAGSPVSGSFQVEVTTTTEPDFLVLKSWYEESLRHVWQPGQSCQVPYLEEPKSGALDSLDYEPQFSMWLAQIVDVSVASEDYPTSNWAAVQLRFLQQSDGHEGEASLDRFSPWEIVPDRLPERAVSADPNAFPEVFRVHALEVLQRMCSQPHNDEFWVPHPQTGRTFPVSLESVRVFFEPVDMTFGAEVGYAYGSIIALPIDLSRVVRRLENYYYRSLASFMADLMLVRENCEQYNAAGAEIAVVAARIVSTCFRELGLVEDSSGKPPALAQLVGPGESPARTEQTEVSLGTGKQPGRSVKQVRQVTAGKPVRQARKRRISSSDDQDKDGEDQDEDVDSSLGSDSESDDSDDGDDESSESDRPQNRRGRRVTVATRQSARRATRTKRK